MKHHMCEKYFVWNSRACAREINRYLKTIADNLVITLKEIIDTVAKLCNDPAKTAPIKFNDKMPPVKWEVSILCHFNNYHVTVNSYQYLLLLLIHKMAIKAKVYVTLPHKNMKMNNQNKSTGIEIKNRTCYYFDDVNNIYNIDLDNLLLGQRSYKDILIYDAAYKTSCGAKPLCIIFDELNGFIRKHNLTKYLTLFHFYEIIFDRIRILLC